MDIPLATYRLQLRNGMGFAEAAGALPWIAGLGVSHLYLSPIQTAVTGSTHGYDVADCTQIDPALGGAEGFAALAAGARAAGVGIILDIVPNHMAFSVQNHWLADVLRHGRDSRFAGHFDIDWSRGKLVLPFLPAPLPALLDETLASLRVAVRDGGAVLVHDGIEIPLAPGAVADLAGVDALRDLLDAQHWQLAPKTAPLSHRRFFNITDLIGMRVEDEAVFAGTHALIFDLVDRGLVQGLRIDHVDGLADPDGYLRRLRARLPGTPVWVEKILTGDEPMPDWPVQGTTGYEAGRAIARVLTDPDGLARLDAGWRQATGETQKFAEALSKAKACMLTGDLAAEVVHLTRLAEAVVDAPEAHLSAALCALMAAMPQYRTYLRPGASPDRDLALMRGVIATAAQGPEAELVRVIGRHVMHPQDAAAKRLQVRFQQVTGALLAKAQEDTAGYRWTGYLAANEVGAEPAEPAMTAAAFNAWTADRARTQPWGLTLTSSHDTKRAEDARMRLVAISHRSEAFLALWHAASPMAQDVAPGLAWYIVQSLLAVWQPDPDLPERVEAHVRKAMREAKQVSTWTAPDEVAETAGVRFAHAVMADWQATRPASLEALIAVGEQLSLRQLVLKMLLPGIPDLYQGTEIGAFHLTDPDNRRPVDFTAMAEGRLSGFDRRKLAMTRDLLHLRCEHARFFGRQPVVLLRCDNGAMVLQRHAEGDRLEVSLDAEGRLDACIVESVAARGRAAR